MRSLFVALLLVSVSLLGCVRENDTASRTTGSSVDTSASSVHSEQGGATAPVPLPSNPGDEPAVAMISHVASGGSPKPGMAAPNFGWKESNGVERSLSDLKGKVVLLNFWGTWCPPCRRELPDIVKIHKEFGPKGLEVIGVCLENVDDPIPHVVEFARSNNLDYLLVIGSDEVTSAYGGIQAVPTTFVVNREGKIVDQMIGMRSEAEFRAAVERAM